MCHPWPQAAAVLDFMFIQAQVFVENVVPFLGLHVLFLSLGASKITFAPILLCVSSPQVVAFVPKDRGSGHHPVRHVLLRVRQTVPRAEPGIGIYSVGRLGSPHATRRQMVRGLRARPLLCTTLSRQQNVFALGV